VSYGSTAPKEVERQVGVWRDRIKAEGRKQKAEEGQQKD
jgi:hypothetical protein